MVIPPEACRALFHTRRVAASVIGAIVASIIQKLGARQMRRGVAAGGFLEGDLRRAERERHRARPLARGLPQPSLVGQCLRDETQALQRLDRGATPGQDRQARGGAVILEARL